MTIRLWILLDYILTEHPPALSAREYLLIVVSMLQPMVQWSLRVFATIRQWSS